MSAKINAKLAVLLGLSLLLMPFANALTVNDFFQNFYGLVENQYAFYTIMFLVTFIFLFSIFFALSKNMPFFKASGGGINPAGQIFALSLSAIATLSLFSYVQGRGGAGYASGFFTNRIGSWGPWGWILLALLILAVVFFALRKHGKGILGEGDFDANLKKLTALLWVLSFILVMYGSISKNRTITTIGAVLFVIAVILTVLTGGFKFGEKEKEPEPPHQPPVPPEPPEGYGTIYGVVSDKATKQEIPYVRIECAGYSAMADPQGNYAVTVPIGTHFLTAAKQGYNNYRSNPIQVASKARIEHNFEMETIGGEKGTIEGKVLNLAEFQQGHEVGVERAEVYLATEYLKTKYGSKLHNSDVAPVRSDKDGKFKFENLTLPMMNIAVVAQKEGRPNTHMNGGRPDHLINLDDRHKKEEGVAVLLDVPIRAEGKISGWVVNLNNQERIKADKVYLFQQPGDKMLKEVDCKDDGTFDIIGIPLPIDRLWVRAKLGGIEANHSRPGGPISLDLQKPEEPHVLVQLNVPIRKGRLKGKIIDVTNPTNPQPIINSQVAIVKEESNRHLVIKQFTNTANGEFDFNDIPFGNYTVWGKATNYINVVGDPTYPAGKHTDQPGGNPLTVITISDTHSEEPDVRVPLKPLINKIGTIKGNVFDAAELRRGNKVGVVEATAYCVTIDQTGRELSYVTKKTGPNGEFEFDYVVFGMYLIYADAKGYRRGKNNDPGGHPRENIILDGNNPGISDVIVPLEAIGPVPPRGAATFELIIGGKSIREKTIDTTDLVTNNTATFTIKNSGSGGVLKWKAATTKGLSLSKTEGSLAKDQSVAVTVNVTDRNVPYIPHVTIVAYAGKGKEVRTIFRLKRAKVIIRYQVVSEKTKELKKAVQEEKKKTAKVEKMIKKDVADKKRKLSIKWDDDSLEDLKSLIDDVENRIKLIKSWNYQIYLNYIEKNTHFQGSLKFIKKIYMAKIKKKQLGGYERYTYQDIFRIADHISVFLDEIVNYCEKHRTVK